LTDAFPPPPLKTSPIEAIGRLELTETMILPIAHALRDSSIDFRLPKLLLKKEKRRNPIKEPKDTEFLERTKYASF